MKFRLFPYIASICFSILVITGCEIINPDEEIPARIQMNAPVFEVEANQGTAKHKITEFWTYADGAFIGAFAPPTEVHHITDAASTSFSFRPGIRNNGIQEDAIIYPFYTSFDATLTTTPGNLSTITPLVRYKPDVIFSLIADFEIQNDFVINFDTFPGSALTRSSAEPFEGQYSGEIILTSAAPHVEVTHAVPLPDLPVDGTPAYLEFHYKTEIPLEVGVLGITLNGQQFPKYFYLLKPNEEWNKIYLELTPYLVESELPAYKILFNARFPSGATQSSYKIQLDNIQVLHQ